MFHIERAKELVPIEARSKNMVSHLSRGSCASFGSSKLHSSKLLSFGVQLKEELEEEEEVAAMEVVALSRAGTLGQVCSSLRRGNLFKPCVIILAIFKTDRPGLIPYLSSPYLWCLARSPCVRIMGKMRLMSKSWGNSDSPTSFRTCHKS